MTGAFEPTHGAVLAAWRDERRSDPGLTTMQQETAAIVRLKDELGAELARIERRIDGLSRRIGGEAA